MKGWVVNVGWALFGLMIVAALSLSAGSQDKVANPSPDSFEPSGAAALMALLKLNGYNARVEYSETPRIDPQDIAIEFAFPNHPGSKSWAHHNAQAIGRGAVAVELPLAKDFRAGSSAATSLTQATRADGLKRSINLGSGIGFENLDSDVTPALTVNGQPVIALATQKRGTVLQYQDGIGLTNRFIDRGDNARVFMELLRGIAKGRTNVVLTTASFGEGVQQGLLDLLGPWSKAIWYQSLFLFALIILTANRRFGLPEAHRATQVGTRELMDAVADTMARSRSATIALSEAAKDADARIRKTLRLPRDASEEERNRVIPQDLVVALSLVRASAEIPTTRPKDALALIKNMEIEMAKAHIDAKGARSAGVMNVQ